ncbi:hypothetical protein ElyMa_003878600 [Elysia marginata]|uniref:Uncharacterized protein n=1 Tax=Elysia marginata TaxID=1093978 RepID=A0AAV4FNF2_9GAST|nr:hypothetical protein ElyMa_003878600 [Elysia marginata]
MYRLLYWLRHSKLDRVDLDELDEAYQELKTTEKAHEEKAESVVSEAVSNAQSTVSASVDATALVKPASEAELGEKAGAEAVSDAPLEGRSSTEKTSTAVGKRGPGVLSCLVDNLKLLFCVRIPEEDRLFTKNELRETVKHHADIQESPVSEATLNLHAVMLLLVTAVLWGFLA